MKIRVPAPQKTFQMAFPTLAGGLNTKDLEYGLRPSESPYMKNLWWQDGVLQCRDGQTTIIGNGTEKGYACFNHTWHGYAFAHVNDELRYAEPKKDAPYKVLISGVPANKGTFFRYFDWLFYKNKGGFYKISFNPDSGTFKAESILSEAYVPTIQINSDPTTGAGDLYQPENRLSPNKKIQYTVKAETSTIKLPVKTESIISVTLNGGEVVATLNKDDKSIIDMATPLKPTSPVTDNAVEVEYSLANPIAMDSVMDCNYAFVGGGDRNICILLSGSGKQPNAVFWNANDNLSMNATYWPIDTFNLVGPTNDPVSGFGSQYKDIICFKHHSIYKLDFMIDEIDKRKIPLFTFTPVNSRTGCDLPWTIQLVENNLVFCNTYQGVHVLRSSSAAYENNVVCISDKVNNPNVTTSQSHNISGLLMDVAASDSVVSCDDDTRYWLCAGDKAYVWDYTISDSNNPTWFLLDKILLPVGWISDDRHGQYLLSNSGAVVKLERTYSDDGNPVEKVYQFPVTDFGQTERLKDVTDLMLVTRTDTESRTEIEYRTDLEARKDLTDTEAWSWHWSGMDLAKTILGCYNLTAPRYGTITRRRPMCRHIQYFSVELRNNLAGQNLGIVSASISYRLSGKER